MKGAKFIVLHKGKWEIVSPQKSLRPVIFFSDKTGSPVIFISWKNLCTVIFFSEKSLCPHFIILKSMPAEVFFYTFYENWTNSFQKSLHPIIQKSPSAAISVSQKSVCTVMFFFRKSVCPVISFLPKILSPSPLTGCPWCRPINFAPSLVTPKDFPRDCAKCLKFRGLMMAIKTSCWGRTRLKELC